MDIQPPKGLPPTHPAAFELEAMCSRAGCRALGKPTLSAARQSEERTVTGGLVELSWAVLVQRPQDRARKSKEPKLCPGHGFWASGTGQGSFGGSQLGQADSPCWTSNLRTFLPSGHTVFGAAHSWNLVEKVPGSFSHHLFDLRPPIATRYFSTDL